MLDEKVINRTIKYFEEALPNENKYIIILEKGATAKLVDVCSENVLFAEYGSPSFWNFVGDSREYSNIIIHYLTPDFARFVLSIPDTSNVVWIVWGSDLYVDMLAYKGYELYANPNDVKSKKSFIKEFISSILRHCDFSKKVKAVSRIPSVVMFNGDYEQLIKYFPDLHPQRRDFFYYPVDDMVGKGIRSASVSGNNIFVGNSASYTNNHLMVFEKLSKLDLKERKVYVPLSYGDAKEDVLEYGNKLLKSNFSPITGFLPLDQYNELMLSSNVFIYGNYRQEAFGNIIVALYIGGSVVLHSKNPLLKDLRDMGFVLFDFDDLEMVLDNNLSEENRLTNRNLVDDLYSRKRLLNLIRTSFG